MASSTSTRITPFQAPERRFFLREIAGLFQVVAAILIFLSLYSSQTGEQWVGAVGDWLARALAFLVGAYVAYAIPFMLVAEAWATLVSRDPAPFRFRSWTRITGSILLIVAACSLLTLHVGRSDDGSEEAMFHAGGLVGSFIVDNRGLNLVHYMGTAGSFIALYSFALAGLILFTETLMRDAARLAMRAVHWFRLEHLADMVGAAYAALTDAPRRAAAAVGAALGRFFGFIRLGAVWNFLVDLVPDFHFRPRRAAGRIMASRPIVEIRGAGFQSVTPGIVPEDALDFGEEEAAEDEEEAEAELPPAPALLRKAAAKPRSSSVFGGFTAARSTVGRRAAQPELDLFPSNYELPSLSLLADPPDTNYQMSESEQERLSRQIEETLEQFKIAVEVIEVVQGPVVTRFALHVAPGIKVSRILALESDLALAMKAQHVRILAPIPGQAAVGIEVPNKRTNPVMLKELMECDELTRSKAPLAFPLGKNVSGEPVVADLAKMPHILIAGATGAGKSVCLNSIIAAMLFRNPPDRVKMIMIDPKRVELSIYQAIPHLLAPVVAEPRKASAALAWAVEQMETRYKQLSELNVRNIDGYNAIVNDRQPNKKAVGRDLKYMPHIVVVIDELADLMMVAKNEVEEYIIRLAQMARAVGIHLIVATQRPSVNVITGIIKANFPTRIAFRVSSKVDSRTILDMNGAEALLGRGDMLYSPGGVKPFRLQGTFVSDAEIESLADAIRAQEKARYVKEDFDVLPTPAERAKAQLMSSALGSSGRIAEDESEEDWAAREAEMERESLEDDAILAPLAVRGRTSAAPLPPGDLESLTDEDLFDIALRLVLESRKASVSYIQRRLRIGYARAGRLMDMMEERGIVGPYQGSKPRDLLVDPVEYLNAAE